ncbi:MAG TPA: SURF1 family protein [Nocardioides sp.]|nr:SURF1 family protein [Nocardioides sp.]
MTSPHPQKSWRFLLSRRWVLFFFAVVVLAWGCWWLGRWQFHRLEKTKTENAIIRANYREAPEALTDVLAVGRPVTDRDEWRVVKATGTYDVADTIIVRYQTDDHGDPGVDVVVPLKTAGGDLLVNRGWFSTEDPQPPVSALPKPPSGQVTVVGWVRQDGSGSSTDVTNHSVRAISSSAIGQAIGAPTYGGFVQMQSETPPAATALGPEDQPDLSNGPHFFYGLQWWFFGVLGAGGFLYLAWDEKNNGDRGARRRAAAAAADAEAERGRQAGRREPSEVSETS